VCVFGRLARPVTVGYGLSRLAKVDVEGSNPFSRSDFKDLRMVSAPHEVIGAHEGGMR
jgi:hypothetical protein